MAPHRCGLWQALPNGQRAKVKTGDWSRRARRSNWCRGILAVLGEANAAEQTASYDTRRPEIMTSREIARGTIPVPRSIRCSARRAAVHRPNVVVFRRFLPGYLDDGTVEHGGVRFPKTSDAA